MFFFFFLCFCIVVWGVVFLIVFSGVLFLFLFVGVFFFVCGFFYPSGALGTSVLFVRWRLSGVSERVFPSYCSLRYHPSILHVRCPVSWACSILFPEPSRFSPPGMNLAFPFFEINSLFLLEAVTLSGLGVKRISLLRTFPLVRLSCPQTGLWYDSALFFSSVQ